MQEREAIVQLQQGDIDGLAPLVRQYQFQAVRTAYMTLLAGLQALIHRHISRTYSAISSPIANRTRHEFESIIGTFLNTLVLRSDLSGNPSFRALLARVRQTALDAFGHQAWPFLNLMRSLNPDRELSQNALFQIMLMVQNVPLNGVDLAAGRIAYLSELDTGISNVDLTIYVDYPAQGPTIAVDKDTLQAQADRLHPPASHACCAPGLSLP